MNISPITSTHSKHKTPTFAALPKKFKVVDDFLIRGPHPSVCDLFQLKKEGVTQIYDFRHKSIHGAKFIEKGMCKLLGIEYIRKPYSNLYGEYPTIQEFEEIAKTVVQKGEKGEKTLFHCNSGRHRTAHMSAFYELTKGKETLAQVKEKLGEKFGERVNCVIGQQITDQNYHSRTLKHYKGYNPIKILMAKINNRYAFAIKKGQKMFIDTIFGMDK